MNDLISRQAAIEALNSINCFGWVEESWSVVSGIIEHIPTAQPEVIRCKDCKYWDTTWQNDYAPNYHYCPLVDEIHRGDFYCADAERRGKQDG